jgi:hypothetical protein
MKECRRKRLTSPHPHPSTHTPGVLFPQDFRDAVLKARHKYVEGVGSGDGLGYGGGPVNGAVRAAPVMNPEIAAPVMNPEIAALYQRQENLLERMVTSLERIEQANTM